MARERIRYELKVDTTKIQGLEEAGSEAEEEEDGRSKVTSSKDKSKEQKNGGKKMLLRVEMSRGTKVVKSEEFTVPDYSRILLRTKLERSANGRDFAEKRIGSAILNLAEYVLQSEQETKVSMQVKGCSKPVWLTLRISCQSSKRGRDDSDTVSERSAYTLSETASVASGEVDGREEGGDGEEEEGGDNQEMGSDGRQQIHHRKGHSDELSERSYGIGNEVPSSSDPTYSATRGAMMSQIEEARGKIKEAEDALQVKTDEMDRIDVQLCLEGTRRNLLERRKVRAAAVMFSPDDTLRQKRVLDYVDMLRLDRDRLTEGSRSFKEAPKTNEAAVHQMLQREARRWREHLEKLKTMRSVLTRQLEEDAEGHGRQAEGGSKVSLPVKRKESLHVKLQKAIEEEKAKSSKYQGWAEKIDEAKAKLEQELTMLRRMHGLEQRQAISSSSSSSSDLKATEKELQRITAMVISTSTSHAEKSFQVLELQNQEAEKKLGDLSSLRTNH
ncbi:hypothetical protein GUITHDRAFT_99406 [Guillardia theta CCMP2712]|uniref:Uncharacterized protein n=1 Tax=Guillardia theta (strain CCMP2712) TaxID=905079 RepID=L1K1N4_GUITC|nr:hypothetical protein GUITHDRAFT_99406 [Guillardia theta CCMP2712]EKX54751.1 hypothetical protein GUITHDRAFT_99406 [Guillardia theta CCMP2712]|eukprot:XP_005841731.1 hypothetical protein GUITHDRAFT_99406 [Guillardia theta CCMP2712]